ncbi:unnamed protein product [Peniophora sp. CBMAI 1063]|nr:unnamed protein product [Peniophora sp. CBMAI 1063]
MSTTGTPNTPTTTPLPPLPPRSQPIPIPGRSQSPQPAPIEEPDTRTRVPPLRGKVYSGAACGACKGINEHLPGCKIAEM